MPILLKLMIVRMRIIIAANRFASLMFTPSKKTPINRYISTLKEVKIKLQSEDKVIIVEVLVGVTSIASNVPIICSPRMLSENPLIAVIRYPEKAMPISTKEK
jgi:hypothetical protein